MRLINQDHKAVILRATFTPVEAKIMEGRQVGKLALLVSIHICTETSK